jgi:3-dehydroquinate synthase
MANLVLVGFMGAGKSTVGRLLAERLGWSFVDVDARIEREAGRSIPELFAQEGEAGFRERERRAIAAVCQGDRQVIAPGGGAVLDSRNEEALRAAGPVVALTAPLDVLWRRVAGSRRPLARDRESFERRYREREALYARYPLQITTGRGPAQQAVDQIVASCFGADCEVPIALGERSYLIQIAAGALAGLGHRLLQRMKPGPCLVVTNPTVRRLYGERAQAALVQAGWRPQWAEVPDAEEAKSLEHLSRLYDAAIAMGLERRQPVIALGGGVVGDLAGFLAATYQRGVPFVQVPTTLLAQIDSSVGGKVAINHPRGKNLIGSFHQPVLVVTDPLVLDTLPEREWRAGLAELVKYAVILDAELFDQLATDRERLVRRDPWVVAPAIARACELKAQVVAQDEREGGLRAILNFGHTVGHALEAVTGYQTYRHGEAVAIGMAAAGEIARRLGMWPSSDQDRLVAWLEAVGLPTRIAGHSTDDLVRAMGQDKKVQSGRLTFVLPEAMGRVVMRSDVPDETVRAALADLGAASGTPP